MPAALTSIGIATLIAVLTAWTQGPSGDAPSRQPPGPPPAMPDADVAGLFRYEPIGLSLLQPYRRGRAPVVFVHGLWSSPWSWSPMVEALEDDPAPRPLPVLDLRLFDGRPDPVFGLAAAADLDEARRKFDPDGTDAAFDRTVVVGHSMGGLLAKMMVQDSGPRLWRLVSDRPFEELAGDPEDRDLFRRGLFFKPRPEVRRVVFIATPHRGSRVDRGRLERLGATRPPPGTAPGGLRAADGPQRAGVLQGTAARACRPASRSWSGGRPCSRACRSWGWPRGSRPIPSSRTGATRPGPAAATASSPMTPPTSTGWRPRSSCRPATCARATPP